MTAVPVPLHRLPAAPLSDAALADAQQVLDAAQTGLLVIQDGRVAYANPMLARMVGWVTEDLVGVPYARIAPSLAPDATTQPLVGMRLPCVRRDGSRFDGFAHLGPVTFAGRPATLVTLGDTIELDAVLALADAHADLLARTESLCRSGSFELYLPSGAVLPSLGLRELLGLTDDTVAYCIDALPWVPQQEQALVGGLWRQAQSGEPFEFEHRVVAADGRLLTVLHRGMLATSEPGNTEQSGIALLQDITAQREAERRMQELATRDDVTGLLNRAAFLDRLDAALHAARWTGGQVTVLAIDIARIAEVRSTVGYSAADALAAELAQRLLQASTDSEAPAQLGGTEFGLLLESEAGAQLDGAVLQRAAALCATLEGPVRVAESEISPRAIVGVASFPADGDSPSQLVERAQTARLRAEPTTPVVFFEPGTNVRALRELTVETALRHAMARQELALHYQPQIDLSHGGIVGAEALLRWQSPELGAVSPAEFIPVAERSGLIVPLGDWVFREACAQTVRWRKAGLPRVRVGINLSAAQLSQPHFAKHVQAMLLDTGTDPVAIGVELTESVAMADVERTGEVLRELRALGIEISLDDFGTGHSSLGCLRSLPVDVVKVDRSFVQDVTASPEDVSVTRAIITMAHGLQMQVLAEGVETEGQLSLLSAHRCDRFQGYWFSPPVPADALAEMLTQKRCVPDRFVTRVRRQRSLLLVDDEPHILSALRRLFRRDGYHIITAGSAEEGLQRLAEGEVDVILSDQRMPGMTGVEFLRRAKDLYPDSVRMVLSGYTELQSIIDAVNEGAIYRFLTKPWDDDRLRQHVSEGFRRKDLADENRRLLLQVETTNAGYQTLNTQLERLVTQQRQQTELLSTSAGSLRNLMQQLPVPVLGLDADGTVVFANRHVALSVTTEPLLGLRCADALPALAAALRTGPCATVELHGRAMRMLVHTLPPSAVHCGEAPSADGYLVLLIPAEAAPPLERPPA